MSTTPSIPFISNAENPTQTMPSSASAPVDSITNILGSLTGLSQAPTAPMNQAATIPGSPHVAAPNIKQMQDTNQQPMRNNRHSERMAENHNKFAQVTNILNSYTNKKETEKYDVLTKNIQDVVTAQNQISNAKAALANNPQDAAAKEVLDKNMKFLEGKLSDDKLRKQMAKAFDISFVDPSKNDTPEVKAGQAAIKAATDAQKAGVDHNTPQEKAVAESLNKPQQEQKQQETTKKANTSYADQFINSRPAALQQNPLYAQQLAQSMKREQLIDQYVIPRAIASYAQQEVAKIKEGGINARTEYKELARQHTEQLKLATQVDISNQKSQTYLRGVAMRNNTILTRARMEIASREKIASDPRFKQNGVKQQLVDQKILESIDSDISKITNQNKILTDQKALTKDPEATKLLDQSIKMNNEALNHMQSYRNQVQTSKLGTEEAPLLKGIQSGITTAAGPTDDSDDTDEDSIIDSGDFSGAGLNIDEQ